MRFFKNLSAFHFRPLDVLFVVHVSRTAIRFLKYSSEKHIIFPLAFNFESFDFSISEKLFHFIDSFAIFHQILALAIEDMSFFDFHEWIIFNPDNSSIFDFSQRHLVFPLMGFTPEDDFISLIVFGPEDSFSLDSVIGCLSFPFVDIGGVDFFHD